MGDKELDLTDLSAELCNVLSVYYAMRYQEPETLHDYGEQTDEEQKLAMWMCSNAVLCVNGLLPDHQLSELNQLIESVEPGETLMSVYGPQAVAVFGKTAVEKTHTLMTNTAGQA